MCYIDGNWPKVWKGNHFVESFLSLKHMVFKKSRESRRISNMLYLNSPTSTHPTNSGAGWLPTLCCFRFILYRDLDSTCPKLAEITWDVTIGFGWLIIFDKPPIFGESCPSIYTFLNRGFPHQTIQGNICHMMSHHHLEISTPTLEWPVPEPHEKYQIDPKNIHGFYALLGLFLPC